MQRRAAPRRRRIGASSLPISELLRKGRYLVPRHQRHYDWPADMVEQFLADLEQAVSDGQPEYFLGTVMLIREPAGRGGPAWEINDGQQRLMTYSLVCAALARRLDAHEGAGRSMRRDLLRLLLLLDWRTCPRTGALPVLRESDLTITPPRHDLICYKSLVGGRDWEDDSNLSRAWHAIGRFLEGPGRKSAGWRDKFGRYLLDGISVVRLVVPGHLDKHAIFETLNARGKQLDDIDLLKNNFLSLSGSAKSKEEVSEAFEHMRIIFRTGKRFTEYARCFLQCNFGHIREGSLYRTAKSFIGPPGRGRRDILPLLRKMRGDACQMFLSVRNPASYREYFAHLRRQAGKAPNGSRGVGDFFGELAGYTVAHPVLLALLMRYGRRKSAKAARFVSLCANVLCSFIMRHVYTRSSFQPSKFEHDLAALALGVAGGTCRTPAEFLAAIREIAAKHSGLDVTSDVEFRSALSSLSMGSMRKAQNFLWTVMRHENPKAEANPELMAAVPVFPGTGVNGKAWGGFSREGESHYRHRLGNLVLVPGDLAAKHQRATSFAERRALYASSPFGRVRALAELDAWGPEQIELQQASIAKTAAKVWNFAA